jgi:hypothetical protein
MKLSLKENSRESHLGKKLIWGLKVNLVSLRLEEKAGVVCLTLNGRIVMLENTLLAQVLANAAQTQAESQIGPILFRIY